VRASAYSVRAKRRLFSPGEKRHATVGIRVTALPVDRSKALASGDTSDEQTLMEV
jgi:hypothetical protein